MRFGAVLLFSAAWGLSWGADVTVPGGMVRVEKNSRVHITERQVELTAGTLTYQVDDAAAAQIEIVTPSVSAEAGDVGVYRVTIRKTGESELTARSGRLLVIGATGEQWLEGGQKMIARGPRGNPQYRIVSAVSWWRRLAGLLQNIQISGGVSAESGGDEKTVAAKETHTKPASENSAIPSGSAHSSGDRGKTSDGHANPVNAGPHSGDNRPASGGGAGNHTSAGHSAATLSSGGGAGSHSSAGHSTPSPSSGGGGSSHSSASHTASSSGGGGSSHSSETHSAPAASSSHSDSSAKGK